MKAPRRLQVVSIVLGVSLVLAPMANVQPQEQRHQAPAPPEDFKFTKVDLDLLDQVNLLDKRFEREGLLYEDEATTAYVQRIGDSLVPRENKEMEHVLWRFRVLRDPIPNAFALPNG